MAEGSFLFSVTLLPLLGSHRKHFEFSHFGHTGAHLLAAACVLLSAAAAVVPILAIASMNNQSEGDGKWQE